MVDMDNARVADAGCSWAVRLDLLIPCSMDDAEDAALWLKQKSCRTGLARPYIRDRAST
jgi:hypothetical protein